MRVVGTTGINQGATGDVPNVEGLYESSQADLDAQGLETVPDEAWLGADDRRWQIANEVKRGGQPTHPVEAEIAHEIRDQGAEHVEAIATVANTGSLAAGAGVEETEKAKSERKKADKSKASPAKRKSVPKEQKAAKADAKDSKDEKEAKDEETKAS